MGPPPLSMTPSAGAEVGGEATLTAAPPETTTALPPPSVTSALPAPSPEVAPLTAPPSVAEPQKSDAPEVSAGAQGFLLKSPGFTVKLGGLVQTDYRFYFADKQKNNFLLRRARPILSGTVIGLVDFQLVPDFGQGTTALLDAYLDAHPFPWLRLRTGKFKPPIGLERLQSDPDLPLGERALTQDLTPNRDVGAQLWGEVAEGIVTYAVGVFDGAADSASPDLDTGASKDIDGRLFFQPLKPIKEAGTLGIGASGTIGDRNGSAKASSLTGLKTVGQQSLFSYAAPAADPMGTLTVFATKRQTRFNPQLYYYYAGFGVLGEVVWSRQQLQLGGTSAKLTNKAWHATVSYVLGGSEGYSGATPDYAWEPAAGHYGAVELAARYGMIDFANLSFPDLADPSTSATKAQSFGFAVNWVMSRQVRLATLFEHTMFDGGGGTKMAVTDRKKENFLLLRGQIML